MPRDLHALYAALHQDDRAAAEAAAREVGEDARRAGAAVVVVSACLLGERTRHDGGDKLTPAVVDPLLADPAVRVLPVCPEILGGMGCPRPPVSFVSGDGADPAARAVDDRGVDRTVALRAGAEAAARLCAAAGAERGVLKERSPSCGVNVVHSGGRVVAGRGAFAARLSLPVVSEQDVLKRKG